MKIFTNCKQTLFSLILLTLANLNLPPLIAADDNGFIYGKITMKNDNVYQGAMRWGKEEAFWDDVFNSTKVENALDLYLSDKELEMIEDEFGSRRRWRRRDSWWGRNDGLNIITHQLKCRFGDIKKMEILGGDDVLVTFKNDEELEVSGGSNDVGRNIKILDEELGEVDLKWRRIDTIEFNPTPKKLPNKFGEALYGEVETRRGRFEGFIQWDHEECLSTDKLDGESEDGKMSIEFGKIKSIKKHRGGSLVTLKSGREFYLDNSNDVDDDNRGVVIKDPRYGKVLVEWREFEEVNFRDEVIESGPGYSDFAKPKNLTGVVKTDEDESISGRIIYDIDEALDLEILDGEDGRIQYRIAFRNIKKITRKGRYSAIIEFKNGEELRLEESRDISRDNDGLLVLNKEYVVKYIPWEEISTIEFK